jgi:PIN domain nuclease of toxin-antitoxin system
VSSASAWEIAIKWRLGRMPEAEELVTRLPELLVQAGFETLPISVVHALAAGGLPTQHRDPFDRMLVAQAAVEKLRLVTKDAAVGALAENVLW